MSTDLLRRAAKQLREDVNRLPEPWRSQPWRVVQSDTENMDAIAVCDVRRHLDSDGAWDCCCASGEGGLGHEAVATYAARMHPAVALALASSLDSTADAYEGIPSPDLAAQIYAAEVRLARALLDEPEGGAP